jgi:hypothetical protein
MLAKEQKTVWNLRRLPVFLLVAAAGISLHFVWGHIRAYPWALAVAPLVPVNESYWEHTKLAVWPLLVYFTVQYFIRFKGKKEKGVWAVSAAAGLWAALLSMFVLHATLIAVFGDGAELAISIIVFFINVWLGMAVFFRVSAMENAAKFRAWGTFLILLLIASEILYTYAPIPIELFRSTDNNYFGMYPPG